MSEPELESSAAADHIYRLDVIARRLEDYTFRYERDKDRRCVFTYVYARMTKSISDRLRSSDVADPEWVVTLAEVFSNMYFEALDDYDQGKPVSAVWQTVFGALDSRRTSILEELVFGMTAHIVHDLPFALKKVGLTTQGSSRIHDFHIVNEMMKEEMKSIQVETARRYSPFVRWLDRMLEDYDEIVTDYGVRMSRGLAWYNAERLLDPASEAHTKGAIEKSPMRVVETLMHPPRPLRFLLRVFRWTVGRLRRWPRSTIRVGQSS